MHKNAQKCEQKTQIKGCALLGLTVSGSMGWLGFFVFYWRNLVSVGLVDQLFQPASNQVEMVEKAFA